MLISRFKKFLSDNVDRLNWFLGILAGLIVWRETNFWIAFIVFFIVGISTFYLITFIQLALIKNNISKN